MAKVFNTLLYGIIGVGIVGLSCCIIGLILQRKAWKVKTELDLELHRLGNAYDFIDLDMVRRLKERQPNP